MNYVCTSGCTISSKAKINVLLNLYFTPHVPLGLLGMFQKFQKTLSLAFYALFSMIVRYAMGLDLDWIGYKFLRILKKYRPFLTSLLFPGIPMMCIKVL